MTVKKPEIQQQLIDTTFGAIDLFSIGSGSQVVLLLHACGTGAKSLLKLATQLATDSPYRIVIPNLVGYGDSHHEDTALSPIQQHLALIDYLLTRDEQQRWHVIGHSMGGFLALQTALRRPQQVISLNLIEPMAFGVLASAADAAALNEDREVIIAFDNAFKAGQAEQGLAGFISYWNGVDWTTLPEPMRAQLLQLSPQIHAEANAVSYDPTPLNTYTGLDLPVQLLISEYAPLPAQRIVLRLSEVIPQAQVKSIAGVGHMGALTHPLLFVQAIQEAFASLE